MSWIEAARRKHANAEQLLAQSLPSFSVPVGDSPCTMPGWIHDGVMFSTIPHVMYPWDPAVLRFIREFDPDAIPVIVRHVYRWTHYYEHGRIDEAITVVRHGIVRNIRDPGYPVWNWDWCEMGSTGRRFPPPNQVRDIWQDKSVREHGPDLPGAYLPFDFSYAYALKRADEYAGKILRESKRVETEEGPAAAGAGAAFTAPIKAEAAQTEAAAQDERAYKTRDFLNYYSGEPSDLEWRDAYMREPEIQKDVVIAVPDVAAREAPAFKEESEPPTPGSTSEPAGERTSPASEGAAS